jgi:hypothetical protein
VQNPGFAYVGRSAAAAAASGSTDRTDALAALRFGMAALPDCMESGSATVSAQAGSVVRGRSVGPPDAAASMPMPTSRMRCPPRLHLSTTKQQTRC